MAAQAGAHLATSNVARPSIFELIASQSLDATFYPALKKLALYLGSKQPEKFAYLLKYYDEIFLIANGIIQNYYLRKNGASLSESFYGLTRFNLRTNKFTRRDYLLSLFVLVILPYAFRKLKYKMTKLNEKLQDEMTIDDKYKVLGLYGYRTIKSTYEFAQIIKYVLYLSGRSQTHSIPFMITGLGLRHADPEENSFSFSDLFKPDIKISTVLGSLALRALEFGGFFLQFLQWYQDSSASKKIQDQLPTPEPPKLDKNANKYSNVCPLCYQPFVIPTVVSISGYAYCYKCITNHLKKHQYCPVSNYPCTIDDLVRVFDS